MHVLGQPAQLERTAIGDLENLTLIYLAVLERYFPDP